MASSTAGFHSGVASDAGTLKAHSPPLINAVSKNQHTPNHLLSDVAWAARESKDWLHELFRDRDHALTTLRMGARSESFQERVRRWKARTTLTIGRLRLTGPVLVGASVAVYSALTQAGLLDTVARGLLAAVLTHLAILVLPFAVLAALPALASDGGARGPSDGTSSVASCGSTSTCWLASEASVAGHSWLDTPDLEEPGAARSA